MSRFQLIILLFVVGLCSLQAQFSISGTVTNQKGDILPGAIVIIEKLNKFSVTNSEGTYVIPSIPAGTHKIIVRFIGYNSVFDDVNVDANKIKNFVLEESITTFEDVVVSSIRAQKTTPTTFVVLPKTEIEKLSHVQDVPYVLSLTPSTVSTSDAGNGVGYTNLRIRGIESSKTNVTINGIPFNDSESHGVYWVDIPDIASYSQSIQIQRGIGTSTNGAGAFGATINLQTDYVSQIPFFEYNGYMGSYKTLKNSLSFGTGLINAHWFLEGKVSAIRSDGYIDRAYSKLQSYFAQAGYYSNNTIVKIVSFGGREKTFQAWYGIDSATLYNPEYGRTYNPTGSYTDENGNLQFYDDMTDNYAQDHLQLHVVQSVNEKLNYNIALHYTYGRGYYQDFVAADWEMPLDFFKLPFPISHNGDTIFYTDLIHRLCLDNHFYGGIWGLNYKENKWLITWGGGIHRYAPAKHFGEIIWARYFLDGITGKKYYENVGDKNDYNTFLKISYNISPKFLVFGDIQYRYINYKAWGDNREYVSDTVDINKQYNFTNPKVGLLLKVSEDWNIYSSYAIANREPTRSDFIEAEPGEEPKPERLYNVELGTRINKSLYSIEINLYDMQYRNQLIHTGEVNSVGTPIRRNVGKSYRRGIELMANVKPFKWIYFGGNATFSNNKTEYTYVDNHYNITRYNNNTIAFAPSFISALYLGYIPFKNFDSRFSLKYVGKQYFDNTQSKDRMLDAYAVIDWLITYQYLWDKVGNIELSFKINNLLNNQYISHARICSSGTKYYYPQAERNYLVGLGIRF